MQIWYYLSYLPSGHKSKGDGVLVTWDQPNELETYIEKVQSAANRLTSENRKLRKCHFTVADKVFGLILFHPNLILFSHDRSSR